MRLASVGLDIWEACSERLVHQRNCESDSAEIENRRRQTKIEPPEPNRYPVSRDQFLRLLLPNFKGRTGEQASICKAWIREGTATERWFYSNRSKSRADFMPSTDEVSKIFEDDWKTPIDRPTYLLRASYFMTWYQGWRSMTTSAVLGLTRLDGHLGEGMRMGLF